MDNLEPDAFAIIRQGVLAFILPNWGKQLVEVVERAAAIKDDKWMRYTL